MYLAFLDSSGNTGTHYTHPTSAIYYLLALLVPGNRARALEDGVTAILRERFGEECRRPGFECKGSQMYRGEGPCSAMAPGERIALFERFVRLTIEHDAWLIWQGIDKPRLASLPTPSHPHRLAFASLAEQVERFLRHRDDYALLIADEEKDVEKEAIKSLSRLKEPGAQSGGERLDLTRIVDTIHWVKSHDSRLLQLCDCCVYLCQRNARDQAKESHTAGETRRLWQIVEPRVWRGGVWP